jgi:hypothetical protein
MNWEAIAAISEAVGAVTIVVTLIYLAVQVRQNTASVRANAYQTWVSANVGINNAATNPEFGEVVLKGIDDPSTLELGTAVGFGLWNHSAFQMWQAIDTLYRMNAIDESLWRAEMSRASGHLANPGVKQWWDAGGKTQLTPEFVASVESTASDITVWGWDSEKGYVRGLEP